MKAETIRNIALVPHGGAGKANPLVDFTFKRSGRRFEGVPLLIGGRWKPEDAAYMTGFGVLVQFSVGWDAPVDITEQVSGISQEAMDRMVMVVDTPEDVTALIVLMGSGNPPRYVRVGGEPKMISELRNGFPDLTVFAGNFLASYDANQCEADAVIIGSSSHNNDELEEEYGFIVDHGSLCARTHHPKIAAFGCEYPGDVAKCFALGAQFVEVGRGLAQWTIEHVIQSLMMSVNNLGGENPHDLRAVAGVTRR